MPTYTDKLPQETLPIKTITIDEVVAVLPETLPFPINLWIADKLARFGKTTESLIFLVEMEEEPSVEMRMYFEKLFEPLGFPATVFEDWKSKQYQAIRLYNEGRLIIDKATMTYKELPTPVHIAPVLTVEEFNKKLPNKIQWMQTIYLTGGLLKNGWSANDVDFIVFDGENEVLAEIRDYFTKRLGWKVDVGKNVMKEREPVFLYKLYEEGWLRLP